jgi:hypothetical protein
MAPQQKRAWAWSSGVHCWFVFVILRAEREALSPQLPMFRGQYIRTGTPHVVPSRPVRLRYGRLWAMWAMWATLR